MQVFRTDFAAGHLVSSGQKPSGNKLLQSLTREAWAGLEPQLESVALELGATLYEMGDPVRWVIFPEQVLLSLITLMASGQEIETSVVGREGGVGFIEALGGGKINSRLIVQVPGRAYRLSPEQYRQAFATSEDLRTAVHRQVELLLAEGRQAVACHSLHSVAARFSRWLLECEDLAGVTNGLPLRQDFLAAMLGVQRTTVSSVAAQAQRDGLISYSRGCLHLLDRPGLERSACECRATLQELRRKLEP